MHAVHRSRALYFSSANIMPADRKVLKIEKCLLRRKRVKGFLVIPARCRGGGKGNKMPK